MSDSAWKRAGWFGKVERREGLGAGVGCEMRRGMRFLGRRWGSSATGQGLGATGRAQSSKFNCGDYISARSPNPQIPQPLLTTLLGLSDLFPIVSRDQAVGASIWKIETSRHRPAPLRWPLFNSYCDLQHLRFTHRYHAASPPRCPGCMGYFATLKSICGQCNLCTSLRSIKSCKLTNKAPNVTWSLRSQFSFMPPLNMIYFY